jgi:hypothetical protein
MKMASLLPCLKKNADMFTGAKFLEAFHCDIKENIQ